MDLNVFNTKGEVVGTVALPEAVFAQKPDSGLLNEIVLYYRNQKRRGSAHTKTRSEVRGGGAKPWKQKGTGRARAGSIRSPLWRKGGIIFGPRPKSFSTNMPKKKLKKALYQSLTDKANNGKIKVIDALTLFPDPKSKPKTKLVQALLAKLEISNKSIIVAGSRDEKFELASRNIPKLQLRAWSQLNAYEVLACDSILFEQNCINKIG